MKIRSDGIFLSFVIFGFEKIGGGFAEIEAVVGEGFFEGFGLQKLWGDHLNIVISELNLLEFPMLLFLIKASRDGFAEAVLEL